MISHPKKPDLEEVEKIAPFEEHLLAKKQMKNYAQKKHKNRKFRISEVKAFAISQAIEKSRQESKAKESKQKGFLQIKNF